jgi:hypothetical protein
VTSQVKQFAQQWKEYVITLDIQAQKGSFGRDMEESKMSKMTQEQLDNFRRLEEEAVRPIITNTDKSRNWNSTHVCLRDLRTAFAEHPDMP